MDFEECEILRDYSDEERRTLIENSLDCLTEDQREVVEMAYFQNMSYSQIAKARGVSSKNSIYKVMKSAEKRIRNYIEDTQN